MWQFEQLPSSLFLLFYYCYLFVLKSCLHLWKKSLLSLGFVNRKIKHYMNILLIYKLTKLRTIWDVFPQHNPNQKSHESTYLTNLMAHVQSFEVYPFHHKKIIIDVRWRNTEHCDVVQVFNFNIVTHLQPTLTHKGGRWIPTFLHGFSF
jgi:hypothetical protein